MARKDELIIDEETAMMQVSSIASVWYWDKVDMKDPAAIETRVLQYMEWCKNNNIRPYVEGCCMALGSSRRRINKLIEQGGQVGEILERIMQMLGSLMEQWVITGKINPVTGIFELKNHHGYSDKTEMSVSRTDEAPVMSQADIIEQLGIETDITNNDNVYANENNDETKMP